MSSTQHQAVPPQPLAITSMAPSPPTIPIVSVTNLKEPVEATATPSGSKVTTPPSQKESTPSKSQCIFPMPIPTTTQRSHSPSCTVSSNASPPLPIIVVPELAIPPFAQPEQINWPRGCKDYKCQMCLFQHANKDCMLIHVHQHLKILNGSPMCGKGFQNAALLWKHGKKVHAIQIVEAEEDRPKLDYYSFLGEYS